MDRNTIDALAASGIKINDVQYKYPAMDDFIYNEIPDTKFVIKGSFAEEEDMKSLITEIRIIRAILKNKHPGVKDLYDQLKTMAGIT